MPIYFLAIGGTGAKVAEAVVHAAAAGLFIKDGNDDVAPDTLEILLVDPDTGNGNLQATTTTVTTYNNCWGLFGGNTGFPWLKTQITACNNLSPCENSAIQLRNYFQYDTQSDENKHFIDVLYTQAERDRDLTKGFAGIASVGAAIMTGIKKRDDWATFLNKIEQDVDNKKQVKIFLCGSIFGGTGASGFPTLGRILADKLDDANWRTKVRLAGCLMLPYFSFQDKKETQIHAKSSEFALRTKAALEYYEAQKLRLDTVYLLGTPNRVTTGEFQLGAEAQRNEPHFIELLATTALRDFLFNDKCKQTGLLGREKANIVSWNDIPDKDEVKRKLASAAIFSFIWLTTIVPDIDQTVEDKNIKKSLNYALRFFKTVEELQTEKDSIATIKKWSESYLVWLGKMQFYIEDEQINLFNYQNFLGKDPFSDVQKTRKSPEEYLKKERPVNLQINLVNGLPDVNLNTAILDKLTNKNITEPNTKTIGFAKALYSAINQKLL